MMLDYDDEWQGVVDATADELASLVNGNVSKTTVVDYKGKVTKRIVIEYEDPADY